MSDIDEDEIHSEGSTMKLTNANIKDEQQLKETSLIQSILHNKIDDIKTKKIKKVKTARHKEQERLIKVTKTIFTSPIELNHACERINKLLSGHKTEILSACRSLDKLNSGRLSLEQFRLVIRDRLKEISIEDTFILMKLFEIDDLIDYRMILDEKFGNGILQHMTTLTVPLSNEIILEKNSSSNQSISFIHTKYVTIYLRMIPFDSFNAYPGHMHINVPDDLSIYALSKMIIDQQDFSTRFLDLFRDKIPSRMNHLDPMRTLKDYNYIGNYVNGRHDQVFPTYTIFYDHSPIVIDCPILRCDHYMK